MLVALDGNLLLGADKADLVHVLEAHRKPKAAKPSGVARGQVGGRGRGQKRKHDEVENEEPSSSRGRGRSRSRGRERSAAIPERGILQETQANDNLPRSSTQSPPRGRVSKDHSIPASN